MPAFARSSAAAEPPIPEPITIARGASPKPFS